MVALKLQNFGAMLPAVDEHLLPQNAAAFAQNAWVNSGSIEGFRGLRKVYEPTSTAVEKVYRIPVDRNEASQIPNSYWLEFTDVYTDVIQAPTLNDAFERFYWTSPSGVPQYNTRARIANGDPPLKLGVPAPTSAPGVATGGGTAPEESRAYVYTYVTEYGEEGPPSPPTLATGNTSGTWDLTLTAPSTVQSTDRMLDKIRIYRTVSGVGGETDYFFVNEQDIATLTYSDTETSVTNNRLLESIFWTSPPDGLEGFAEMPNGIIASWQGSEIWFCQPYRPHAWPVSYQVAVDSKIVGCGVLGQTLIVCTEGQPYAVSGINPASMSLSQLATFEPCTARGSIVSTAAGVMYASPNGLVMANASTAAVISRQIIDKPEWGDRLSLYTLFSTQYDGGYYCFGSTRVGCFSDVAFDPGAFLQLDFTGSFSGAYIDANDPRVAYTVLRTSEPVKEVHTDTWSGEVFVHRADGVYWLDQSAGQPRDPYIWKSKILETPKKNNFQAMRVYFTTFPNTPELNPVRNTSQSQTLQADQWGIIRVYADGVLRLTRELRETGEFFRLPSGFKATFWQIEIEGRVRIDSVEVATSARDLMNV